MIDSHCHLDHRKFESDREAAIERAQAAGVEIMLTIGTGDGPPDDLEAGIALADKYPFIWTTVGIHPHEADKCDDASLARIEELLKHPKVLALGEIGLDYHYNFSPPDRQKAVFRDQMAIAARAGKPIIIHTREAWGDTLNMLRAEWKGTGIMHCFSGGAPEAQACLNLGFYLSFAGVITYSKSEGLQEAARIAPLDRILVETDAPYLAPVPHRGKRNEPAFVVSTAARVAELKGITTAEIDQATTENFWRLLRLSLSLAHK